VTARQEPNESEDRQEKSWHAPIVPLHTVLSQSFTRGRNNGEGQGEAMLRWWYGKGCRPTGTWSPHVRLFTMP
jgi:hypothetical protein